MAGGYGAALLRQPARIAAAVREARARSGDTPISIKIRIDDDPR
jgi:tRNA-dihydrouridine synthase